MVGLDHKACQISDRADRSADRAVCRAGNARAGRRRAGRSLPLSTDRSRKRRYGNPACTARWRQASWLRRRQRHLPLQGSRDSAARRDVAGCAHHRCGQHGRRPRRTAGRAQHRQHRLRARDRRSGRRLEICCGRADRCRWRRQGDRVRACETGRRRTQYLRRRPQQGRGVVVATAWPADGADCR